ncbi:unnamed protein product [Ophioblennius macclurei]
MWSYSSRRVLHELLSVQLARSFRTTAAQNTVIVERWWQVPLSKVGSPPRLNPRRHRIYKLVEDKKNLPQEKMELILTETVPKLGGRGDTVFVKKSVGRNKLLAQGLAVYASPENKQMFSEELRLLQEGTSEERSQTRTGQLTVELLRRSELKFRKMPCEEYQITKEVVIRQLAKKLGVIAQPHTVNFPFESAKDVGDYWCEITVNGLDTVRLPITVLPYEDMSAAHQRLLKTQKATAAAPAAPQVEATDVSPAVTADVPAATEVLASADVPPAVEAAAEVLVDAAAAAAAPEASAADIAAKEKDDGVLEAVSTPTSQAEAVKDAPGKSADEETAAPAQTAPDATAPESPEKK